MSFILNTTLAYSMLNDLYCDYYPSYKFVDVADTDQCYRVCTMWSQSYKPTAYERRHPRSYGANTYIYAQATFGRHKQILLHQHKHKRGVKPRKLNVIAMWRRIARTQMYVSIVSCRGLATMTS